MKLSKKITGRYACFFADGSITISPAGWPIERVHEERADSDQNETDKSKMTKIGSVTLVVDAILFDPTKDPPPKMVCSHCNQAKSVDWTFCPYCGFQGERLMKRTKR